MALSLAKAAASAVLLLAMGDLAGDEVLLGGLGMLCLVGAFPFCFVPRPLKAFASLILPPAKAKAAGSKACLASLARPVFCLLRLSLNLSKGDLGASGVLSTPSTISPELDEEGATAATSVLSDARPRLEILSVLFEEPPGEKGTGGGVGGGGGGSLGAFGFEHI